jgi:glycyl-tRNA synthetase
MENKDNINKIIALLKRRGFVYPSSEIYGGFGSVYDYGPMGIELKNNIKSAWWKEMTMRLDDIIGLDSGILASPKIWEASGHLSAGFADELVECKGCKKRFKLGETEGNKCPECGKELMAPRKFNLMMKTFIGPAEDSASVAYMRAETCQGIFVNFKNVLDSSRVKIPFGIAQIGKAFRNEINPGNFIFRMREFEQMEMEWFCNPNDTKSPNDWFEFFRDNQIAWLKSLGLKEENLRLIEVPKEDRSHYAQRQIDIEYKFPFGWKEIEGIHNRGDWDLSNHSKFSGQDLSVSDITTKQKFIPHVIETSVGVERLMLALLCEAYSEIEGGRTTTTESAKEKEEMLALSLKLAPIKIAIFPLVKNKEDIVKKSEDIYNLLKQDYKCQYDESGTVGRRYRRQDEIGTPFCITVDYQSLEDDMVTIRDISTMEQSRIEIKKLKEFFSDKLK